MTREHQELIDSLRSAVDRLAEVLDRPDQHFDSWDVDHHSAWLHLRGLVKERCHF
jgi:hypothetical protein